MPIGIIAGAGSLPLIILEEIKKKGYKVVIVSLEDIVSEDLSHCSDAFIYINIGKFGEILKFLKKNKVKEIVLTGKVPKRVIYEKDRIKPDARAVKMLFSAKLRGDNELLKVVEKELLGEGIRIIGVSEICPELLTPEGILTKNKPSKEEWEDIKYGFSIAKEVGKLDIGQTVIVKDKATVAVEAIEGTDETIIRAGNYVEDTVIVKVSKPQQDLRLDPPVAGINTIMSMQKAKAKILALEAEKTLLLQRNEVIQKANEFGIAVVGVRFS
ncbi:MAG: UDP-2,3-diacylglucosamine diphosphatase LpxI [Thermodesulfovibrio sp.]|nr:UDP-2,3-diacylglucosamine diphosphatase LpxI [Thermodesulfovibrio sp.]